MRLDSGSHMGRLHCRNTPIGLPKITTDNRNPSQPLQPESSRPRGSRADEAGAPDASLYIAVMTDEEMARLGVAMKVQGVDLEIALLRLRIERVLKDHPEDTLLLFKGIELLIRAVGAKSRSSNDSSGPSEQLIENILRDVGLKLGLNRIPWDSNC